jgi:hypothetical protein
MEGKGREGGEGREGKGERERSGTGNPPRICMLPTPMWVGLGNQ